jgi:hypothetical protein
VIPRLWMLLPGILQTFPPRRRSRWHPLVRNHLQYPNQPRANSLRYQHHPSPYRSAFRHRRHRQGVLPKKTYHRGSESSPDFSEVTPGLLNTQNLRRLVLRLPGHRLPSHRLSGRV